MTKRRVRQARSQGEEILASFFGFVAGYFGAEGFLRAFAHPFHWLAAVIGGAVGYFGVLLWYRWKQRPRHR